MLQFSAGQSGAQLPHELRTRTADSAARRDIIHTDNYTTFALLLNGKRKTKKKLIGFALLYVIVCTHYVCGVVYVSACCYQCRNILYHWITGWAVSGEGIPNIISWWWCTQVQATVQTENLTASCVLNGEISLINVKIGYRIHKDK